MHWIDWVLLSIPLLVVLFIGMKSQKYVRGVADFLTAGRVGGRYVVSVASGEAGMGLISAIAIMEMYYSCGFAVSFWSSIMAPLGLIMGLTGFCIYRFRETKAMTMGQFFELRYNKSFRVVAAVIQSLSGIINYAIFPAVGARFLIYFLNLPIHVSIFGFQFPTFILTMMVFLGFALFIALMGGQVTIMTTDCVQGLLSYPMYGFIVVYLLYRFSWGTDMLPILSARPPGESFLSPYDVQNLRDFNLFYVFSGIVGMFLNRMSWGGCSGYNGAALNAHEAKMGGLLGTWRGGFGSMTFILLAVIAIAYLNAPQFSGDARRVRTQLAEKTISDILPDKEYAAVRTKLGEQYKNIPEQKKDLSQLKVKDQTSVDPYVAVTRKELAEIPGGKKSAQTFETIYNQMSVSMALRDIFPIGITGIFCAMMIFLMVSTDTTYMHSWGTILIQDFVVPLRKKPYTPHEQIRALRWSITGVCIFAILFSYYFAQVDFILMFFAITGAIWAGAGVVITLGLYWNRGTTEGAFVSLVTGALIAVAGIILQQIWVSHAYPFIQYMGWTSSLDGFLKTVSGPFHPYVIWEMTPHKFPINSMEVSFIANIVTVVLYVVVSLCTCKEPFNMERLLHRGIYSENPTAALKKQAMTLKNFFYEKILGIDSNYTRGDKILAWSVFIYSFGYGFTLCFLSVVIWNVFMPWPIEWWGYFFFIRNIVVAVIIAVVSTVWFSIGGTVDLIKMFRTLDAKKENVLDDGRVVGNVSTADVAVFEQIEKEQGTPPTGL